uniref:Uncharacterized protein n=1 Tax=Noccaea caerulescens TaxID=107243 RepID=A0A1J3GJ22_NOCCA
MVMLVEGQEQFKVSINDLKRLVEERYKELLEKTTLWQYTTGGVSKGVKDLTKCLEDMEERDRASKDTKAADSKPNNALVAFGVRETNPRVVWDEDEKRQGKRTAMIRGRRLPEGTLLSPRSSQPPVPKEKRKASSSMDYTIDDFNFMARRFPSNMPFDVACNKSPYLQDFVWTHDWSLAEVEKMYNEAREEMHAPRTLHKLHDPGYFLIHCSINGKFFDDALCDSGSCVNLMPAVIARSWD